IAPKHRLQSCAVRVYTHPNRSYFPRPAERVSPMALAARRLGLLVCAALLGVLTGCWGGAQNPSYFPYLLPTGDVIKTHAKPIGPGYYANFDPYAVDLAVEPQTMTSQVGSQVVILATVRDDKGVPRRERRVEWKVTNGNIIEVDESGC